MTKIIELNLFCIFSLLFLLSSKQSVGTVVNAPTIVAGTSKITGRIISLNDTNKNNISVIITVPHPISGEYVNYKAFVDRLGKFSIDIDVETDISLISINTSLNPEKYLLVKLTSGGVTTVNLTYNSDDDIADIKVTPFMNQNDVIGGFEIRNKMITYRSGRAPEHMYNKSPNYFLNFSKTALSERLDILENDTLISKDLREVLAKDYRLILYYSYVFDYKGAMMLNYSNTNGNKSKMPNIQKIDRRYYRFLKNFNLNDPQYLNCFQFLEFQGKILQNETLNLPQLGESDIPSWLAKVKIILSDLIGFDHSPYYDILTANAYGRQLNEEVKPLTERQKKNISDYWRDGEIAKILFRKNQQVVELDRLKSPTVVNDISLVSDNKVIETIVAKHKGKVVLIDLWATWCGPCLQAMKEFRSTKDGFHDKDVAFVYLTDGSSPRKLWEEKIKGIGNEHYYLNTSQWKYVMDHFGFEYIPSYLIYDKQGVLIKKITAFSGNEKFKEIIDGLL